MSKYFHNMLMIFLLYALCNPSNSLAAISYSIKNPEPAIGFDPNKILFQEYETQKGKETRQYLIHQIDFYRPQAFKKCGKIKDAEEQENCYFAFNFPPSYKHKIEKLCLKNLFILENEAEILATGGYGDGITLSLAGWWRKTANKELETRGWCRGYPKTTPIEDQVYAGIIYLPCKSAA